MLATALLLLAACAPSSPSCAGSAALSGPTSGRTVPDQVVGGRVVPDHTLYVVDHGWHTDLVLPAGALRGPLAAFRERFPGLRFLLLGFGRRTFMTAPVTGVSDLLVGPFPGRGVLLVAALSVPPDRAYHDGTEARLPLDEAAARRLSDFLWRSFRLHDGAPVVVAPGFFPGSLFFDTAWTYSGLHTCNDWTADALHAAALLPQGPALASVFSGQVMRRLRSDGAPLCRIGPPVAGTGRGVSG